MRKRSLRGMLVPCDVQGLLLPTTTTGDEWMRIAQVAPLTEAVPPKLYGGTERGGHWVAQRMVALGKYLTRFTTGDFTSLSKTEGKAPKAPPPSRKGSVSPRVPIRRH